MHQLLPLAVSSRNPAHANALVPVYAEDATDGAYIEALIAEALERFPQCETLYLYFEAATGDRMKGWVAIQTLMLETSWGDYVANVGSQDTGDHGLLVWVGVHIRGRFGPAKTRRVA